MNSETFSQSVLEKAHNAFLKHGTQESIPKGKKVIEEGEFTEYLYYVTKGEFRTFGVASVYPIFFGRIKVGQTFGEASFLLGGRTATATVLAVKAGEVCKISFEKLSSLIRENDQDALSLMYYLAHSMAVRIRRMDVNFFKTGLLDDHTFAE